MVETILQSPFFGMSITVGAFILGNWIQKKTGWLLANPLILGSAAIIAVLLLFDIPYEAYEQGGSIVQMLLGPVTALLAIGIYNQRNVLKQYFLPVLTGCLAGSLTSILSVLGLCRLFGLDAAVTAALLPKSCTTPIALSIANSRGGLAAIAAFAVVITGVTGALGAPVFAKWLGIRDPIAQGLAIGTCSHALGTTRAREIGELQGAMSSIAIGVCGLISVVLTLFIPV